MNLTQKISLFFFSITLTLNVKAEFTGQDSVDLMNQWQHDFDVFLLNHTNPNLHAYGVYSLTYDEDEQTVEMKKES